ncbi:uncharacterized protein PV07_03968 [Cladophialophora immunda]|uniref:Uncharacterized protein n=1 Tax=Cladophialophora immunda TaxID=569365 RepID=A0A0D2D9N6_9EURO|nr:uncharacterized protein PV07_03968 [Cladophialophora immunda]KIW32419.1 hypothetical protein PV07_03968 [Cladophialophora immunda]
MAFPSPPDSLLVTDWCPYKYEQYAEADSPTAELPAGLLLLYPRPSEISISPLKPPMHGGSEAASLGTGSNLDSPLPGAYATR